MQRDIPGHALSADKPTLDRNVLDSTAQPSVDA
jgi:hypothetical protein